MARTFLLIGTAIDVINVNIDRKTIFLVSSQQLSQIYLMYFLNLLWVIAHMQKIYIFKQPTIVTIINLANREVFRHFIKLFRNQRCYCLGVSSYIELL